MTKTSRIWLVLAVLYGAFFAWHYPWKGPLTEQEVEVAFGDRFAQLKASEDPRAKRFVDFLLSDDGRPFYMVNLNELAADSAETADAAGHYAAHMLPRLLSRASYPVLWGEPFALLHNSLDLRLDAVERLIVVRYRSRRDFLEIVATPEFQEAVAHKYASLNGWYSAPASVGSVVSMPLFVLAALVAIGLVGTLLRSRMSASPAVDSEASASRTGDRSS